MKLASLVLIAAASVLRLPAAVPLSWTVETTRATPATFEAYQGETLTFEAALQSRGKPLEAPLNYSFFWQTNGMGNAYWEAPCTPPIRRFDDSHDSTITNVLFATWLPDYDVGAKVYNCFIGSPSNIYHAAFQLRLRPSPGALPNALPLPVPVIDFARVRVLNPPWSGGGGVDTNAVIDIANATIATNPVVAAKLDGPAVAPTNTAEAAGKAADAKLTGIALTNRYTRAEADAMLAGKADVEMISENDETFKTAVVRSMNSTGISSDSINIGGSISGLSVSDQYGDLREGINTKADRADSSGDVLDDEIATLDAYGNPTRSGIAASRIETVEDTAGQALETAMVAGGEAHNANEAISILYTEDLPLKADRSMISATDPTFSNAVLTVTTNTIRREVSAALNTYVDGETGVEYKGEFYGGSFYYVPSGNVYPPNN